MKQIITILTSLGRPGWVAVLLTLAIFLSACSATLNAGEPVQPAYTTTTVVYDGATWHGEYYNDRWNWTRVD